MGLNLLKIMICGLATVTMASNAAVVLVGHPTLSDSFTQSTAKKLYLGKLKKLSNGQQPNVIELPAGNPLKVEFHKKVTHKDDAKLKSYWSRLVFTGKGKAPNVLTSSELVKAEVSSNPNSIGYIDESEVDSSVKVIFKP